MHKADLNHSDAILQKKLEEIYSLRRTRSKVNWDREQFFELLAALGNPHEKIPPVIHVGGTNGKGSVIAMLRAILEAEGYKVHTYTSPHLVDMNERIYLAGTHIENDYLEALIDEALALNKGAPLSFFEITTALAFKAFSEHPADILLLEVGMGGRLDCTNVFEKPLACVINRISMDHTVFLGDDIKGITLEKAGIMKSSVPCLIGDQDEFSKPVMEVLCGEAQKTGAINYPYGEAWDVVKNGDQLIFTYHGKSYHYPLPALEGAHQIKNAGLTLATLFSIRDRLKVTDESIALGLQNVKWEGRLQQIPSSLLGIDDSTEIWLDSGHNDSASKSLVSHVQYWKELDNKEMSLVFGMLGSKDPVKFLTPFLPFISELNITPISYDPSSRNKKDIMNALGDTLNQVTIHEYPNVIDALRNVAAEKGSQRILVTGSLYLVGEVLKYVRNSH